MEEAKKTTYNASQYIRSRGRELSPGLPNTRFLVSPNILLRTLFSHAHNVLYSSPYVSNKVLRWYKIAEKEVQYICIF
jgi:hypothetical protein